MSDNIITITSNNQSGWITAHTVNLGAQPRQMNDENGEAIIQSIPTNASVEVVATWGDQEALNFWHQVLNWMKDKGYIQVRWVNLVVRAAPIFDQTIETHPNNEYKIVIGSRV